MSFKIRDEYAHLYYKGEEIALSVGDSNMIVEVLKVDDDIVTFKIIDGMDDQLLRNLLGGTIKKTFSMK